MDSIFGITNLRIATFTGHVSEITEEVNAFLEAYDGNIVNVMTENGNHFDIKVIVLYKAKET